MSRAAAPSEAGPQRDARPLRQAWQLAAPFWRSERGAWVQLAAIVALSLGTVWINVRFSAWNNAFYDALQGRQLNEFWHQIGVFGLLAAAYIVIAVLRLVMQQRLVMHWRTSLTDQLLGLWLQPGAPYRLATATATPDNPDQRIADDARSFVSGSLELALGLLNASVTLVSFVAILWNLSGSLAVPGLQGWVLPGYMVWVALIYSVVGTLLVKRLGAPLIPTNVRQQQVEADFRYALVQVRDQAEAIALARGEAAEGRRLRHRFAAIAANWSDLIRYNKRLTWFSAGYDQLANVFPLLAAAPRFFAGELQLGGLMQTAQAFGQVQGSLSWFIGAYASLADWRATVSRLAAFRAAMAKPAPLAEAAETELLPAAASTAPRWPTPLLLRAQGLVVTRPQVPETLLEVPELSLRPGEWLLVTGASGSGKSSLLRTLAGLWPAGSGWLHVPEAAVFVPQRPYLAQAGLAELLAYPHPTERFSTAQMQQALEHAGLGSLAGLLDDADAWARRLSPGEQQRLQFARLFLQRPDWIVLDEATSALDAAAQVALLRQLRETLPAAAVLSIGHREELIALHDRVLCVQHGVLRPGRPLAPQPGGETHRAAEPLTAVPLG